VLAGDITHTEHPAAFCFSRLTRQPGTLAGGPMAMGNASGPKARAGATVITEGPRKAEHSATAAQVCHPISVATTCHSEYRSNGLLW